MKLLIAVIATVSLSTVPLKSAGLVSLERAVQQSLDQRSLKESMEYLAKAGIPVLTIGALDFHGSPDAANIHVKNGVVVIEDGINDGLDQTLRFSVKSMSLSDAFEKLSQETGLIFLQIDKDKRESEWSIELTDDLRSIRDTIIALADESNLRSISLSPIKGPNVGEVLGYAVSLGNAD